MMRRNIIAVAIIVVLCTTYIFGFEYYDSLSTKIRDLYSKVQLQGMEYCEVGIELNGVKYEETLKIGELVEKQDQMTQSLAHQVECSKLCKQLHYNHVVTSYKDDDGKLEAVATSSEENGQYTFTLRNQKDIHYNTYYDLKIKGLEKLDELDKLRSRGYDQLLAWGVKPKESIYFKGWIKGDVTSQARNQYAHSFLSNLKAKSTNYYESDVDDKIVAFYGYTNEISQYIEEVDGQKTNVQISFSYDELEDKTNVIIAFPFYNEPF